MVKYGMEKLRKILVPFLCLVIALGGSVSYLKKGDVVIERAAYTSEVNEETAQTESKKKSQSPSESSSETSSANSASNIVPVDLNTATAEELQIAPGIGPSKAEAIIKYRKEYGNFTSVDELIEISGIGEKTLAKIRDYYVVK